MAVMVSRTVQCNVEFCTHWCWEALLVLADHSIVDFVLVGGRSHKFDKEEAVAGSQSMAGVCGERSSYVQECTEGDGLRND